MTTQSGTVLLTLGPEANLFLNGVSAPMLESTGELLVSHDVHVGSALFVQGTNVLDAIAILEEGRASKPLATFRWHP